MHKLLSIIIVSFTIVVLFPWSLKGQTTTEEFYAYPDTIVETDIATMETEGWLTSEETLITTDTVIGAKTNFTSSDTTVSQEWKPDPMKTAWWGAVVPGMGQIINRKYWKLPIVYGGFMGCAFAITYTSERYNTYRTAWKDILDNDPATNSFLSLYPKDAKYDESKKNDWASQLKSGQDNFRRYRDLSIVITIVYYGLTILEAYVDAQLYDFDISPDLSMRVQPTIINNDLCRNNNQYGYSPTLLLGKDSAVGVQFNFTIK